MYLKALTLKGFKSFAEPATLRLEPGVTVVVGPNGSGKSNVVDAVAWVLGAQAPSTVRSSKMDDVIFAGSANKAALGRAEVSLTIDNSDGALAIASGEVRISRTLFRSGESSYALNGTPCRLLDITELLSDTGVGRQQHMIVSQSQIDAVLNARPTDRRAVVEEAAGILKYRKRRERAERRLLATDADLTRAADITSEVRRQLRPLELQAEAARRHADLVSELQALRVHCAVREIEALRERLREHRTRSAASAEEQALLRAELDAISEAAARHEQRLARHGMDDHSERLARLEGLRARATGQAAVVAERRRSLAGQAAMLDDHDMVTALAAEARRCRRELDDVEAETATAASNRSLLEQAQQRLALDRSAFEDDARQLVGLDTGAAGETAEVRGELSALESNIAGNSAQQRRLAQRRDEAETRLREFGAGIDTRHRELSRCHREAAKCREDLRSAEAARDREAAVVEAADSAVTTAQAELRHWRARREALTMALDESAPTVPTELEGVLGMLGDLVETDPGVEAAFAAGVGDAMNAVVATDAAAARRVLSSLEVGDPATAVIVLQRAATAVPLAAPMNRPGCEPLRDRVRAANPWVAALLDALLASVVLVDGDWQAAAEVWQHNPGLVAVTAAGDRLSDRGWRLGVQHGAGIRIALTEAVERAAAALAAVKLAEADREQARRALVAARRRVDDLSSRLSAAELAAASGTEAIAAAESERRELETATVVLREHIAEVTTRLDEQVARRTLLGARLPELEQAEISARRRGEESATRRGELDKRASELAQRAAQQSAGDAGLAQRRRMLEARLAELDERLARHEASASDTAVRLAALQREDTVLEALHVAVTNRTVAIGADLSGIRELRRKHSEVARTLAAELDVLRRSTHELQDRYEELRRAEGRADIEEAELRTLLQGAVERLRDAHGRSPQQAAEAPLPELPEGVEPEQRIEQLAEELQIIGPVNPLALAEYDELRERYELLRGQLDDIRAARRDLNRVIRSIDAEIKTVFSSAFADVAANFEVLFEALFPGGEGRLSLTDPDELLETGIDISAKPSGKNVKRLSLLSGGERTLAALAFLFAVFRSRPSPFYVMDEVEAALDDVNLHRFLRLVDEFRADAQLVIVTHQKRTMEAADCLQGVSMKPGGSSMVVSERVSDAA